MTSALRGAPRSSPRLLKKQEAQKRVAESISHNPNIEETSVSPDPSSSAESHSSCSVGSNGNSQSLHGGNNSTFPSASGPASVLRTTTSRRGGRPGVSHSPRAAAAAKQNSNINQFSSTSFETLSVIKPKEKKREMVPMGTSTPSSAAAAAAAAAKALCDNTNRSRYGVDPYRGFHAEDRQNVFRVRRDDGMGRITTRSSKNGIRKPKTTFGKSTHRVMGSHTPTHIPRHHSAYDRPRHEHRPCHFPPRNNTTASVFRERPIEGPDPRNFEEMRASPPEMLLSLKSGSKSFELVSPGVMHRDMNMTAAVSNSKSNDGGSAVKRDGNSPLSPEAPPRIQHSHHEAIKSDSLFFNPRTPKTPKTPNTNMIKTSEGLHGTPSFSLFDKSFDSFGDSGYLRSPNIGSTLNDQGLPSTLSLAPSYEDSPRKKAFGSPNPHLGFTFSPHKQKSQDLDEFPVGSPSISLDNVIVDTMDAPLMPRAPNCPSINNMPDPLLTSNVMVLDQDKTVRNIPAPIESPRKRSYKVPFKKRLSPGPSYYGHRPTHHLRSPHSQATSRQTRAAPPPPSAPQSVPRQKKSESPAKVLPAPAIRRQHHIPNRHPKRPSQVPSHARGHQSPYYSERQSSTYVPEKKDTSLASFDAEKINERLASHCHAFKNCSHLLPGFKKVLSSLYESTRDSALSQVGSSAVSVSPDRSNTGKKDSMKEIKSVAETDKQKADRVIASRRVKSAICAFGGNFSSKKGNNEAPHYKGEITNRYFEHQNRISWDVEEDPPVESPRDASENNANLSLKRKESIFGMNQNTPKKFKPGESSKTPSGNGNGLTQSTPSSSEAPKMRYRCKLCGQPKQNHTCPYEKSLQRSIGITVHAAINAFTAAEPGELAPALTEMNNFVPNDDLPEITPARPRRAPIAQLFRGRALPRSAPHVTPEAMRSMNQARKAAGYSVPNPGQYDQFAMPGGRLMPPTPVSNIRRRRILSPEKNATPLTVPSHKSDLVFVEANLLRSEQFRLVAARELSSFEYPSIPLPYPQRKSLSDNLFELSNELPTLKEECAVILRKAREADAWDVAVAELLAQLIVAIHCPEKDTRLEGLSRYLSSLGIAC